MIMKVFLIARRIKIVLFSCVLLFTSSNSFSQLATSGDETVQNLVDLAFLLADDKPYAGALPMFLGSGNVIAPLDPNPLRALASLNEIIAVKAFDDLYYIGYASVGTWVLETDEGLILFDALNSEDDAKNVLVPKMLELGLDPNDIKYLVIMHGHFDHFGGARYIQDNYNAQVYMGDADWAVMELSAERMRARGREIGELPVRGDRGSALADGDVLSLGGKSVTFYVTPGHTLATFSAIIPTTYKGISHVVSFWGGNGMPNNLEPSDVNSGIIDYRYQLLRFTKLSVDAGADAIISNHPVVDGTYQFSKYIAAANEVGQAVPESPWVVGRDAFVRIMAAQIVALNAAEAHFKLLFRRVGK